MPLPRCTTWRLQSVPISISREGLRLAINKSLKDADTSLRIDQLSPASDDDHSATATVTFDHDPVAWVHSGPSFFSISTDEGNVAEVYFDKDFDGFTPLYTPSEDVEHQADIIAVSGLAGHALGSWKDTSGTKVWLRDFLPRLIPSARVLVYGYESKLQQKVRKDTIRDFTRTFYGDLKTLLSNPVSSERPIILIGHSLGGLIVKECVTLARADLTPAGLRLYKRMYALMTFGAPNLGLRNEGLLSVVKGQLNEELVRNLVVTSESEPTELLKILNDHFIRATKFQPLSLMLCYEREASSLVEMDQDGKLIKSVRTDLLVTEHSATFVGRQAEEHEQRSIARDHSQMVKFRTPNDKDYKFVASVLRNWISESLPVIKGRFSNGSSRTHGTEKTFDNAATEMTLSLQCTSTAKSISNDVTGWQPHLAPTPVSKPSSKASEETTRATIKSLVFNGMFFRKDDVKTAALNTCEWIFEHEKFRDWMIGNSKLLWISGKPGTGKSVLMDRIFKFCTDSHGDDLLILHFFFYGRGIDLQRTAAGLMQSLCHQLICSIPEALDELARIYEQECKQYGSTLWSWSHKELKLFFERWIKVKDQKRKLILLDALDEAGRETTVELVTWLKELIFKDSSAKGLGICFSCRHYPVIHVDQSTQIVVEENNSLDIEMWVSDQLCHISGREDSQDIQTITNAILSRAQGVFLWAVLVVRSTVQLYLDGATLPDILDMVGKVPAHLQELYGLILEEDNAEKRQLQRWLFTWLCFSPGLMNLHQLALALELTVHDFHKGDYACDKFKRKLRFLSNGLCEMVNGKSPFSAALPDDYDESLGNTHNHNLESRLAGEQELRRCNPMFFENVQLIHQSVKDFFLETGFVAMNPSLADGKGIRANMYQSLAEICLEFLQNPTKFSDQDHDPWSSSEAANQSSFRANNTTIARNFKSYCLDNLPAFVGLADRHGIDQSSLLHTFQWPQTSNFQQLGTKEQDFAQFALVSDAPSLIAAMTHVHWGESWKRASRAFGLGPLIRHVCLNSHLFRISVFQHPDFKVHNRAPGGDTYLTSAVKCLDMIKMEAAVSGYKSLPVTVRTNRVLSAIGLLLDNPDIEIDAIDFGSRFTALDLAELLRFPEAIELINQAKSRRIAVNKANRSFSFVQRRRRFHQLFQEE